MCARDALLLIGHGSARYADAGAAMHRHVESIRAEGLFAQVEAGLLNGAPPVQEALTRIDAASIRIVPFFMEDGYFSRVAVPRVLGDAPFRMCSPIGIHEGMAEVIELQAVAACVSLGILSHTAAVVIAGHGSSSAPGRTLALHRHAASVAATGRFARVEAACLEEAPFVADTLAALRAYPVVVIGFFAGEGGHVRDDVPALIAAEQAARDTTGFSVWFLGSVADDPAMTRIILDQATRDLRGE